ncbi:CstA-like transporter-associated (seleno)protein, partial [Streptomyces sp. NPDC003691]
MTVPVAGPAVRRWLAAARWYLREVSGESAYDRYCEHRRRHRPGEPVPTRRESAARPRPLPGRAHHRGAL